MTTQAINAVIGKTKRTPVSGRGVVIVLALTAAVLIVAISGWALASLRSRAIADAEIQTSNLARAFASHATRSVGEFVIDFNAVARQLANEQMANEGNEPAVHQLLQNYLASEPQLRNTFVINADGKIIASSEYYPQPQVDVSDRAYFLHHKNDPSPEIFFAPVMVSRIAQQILVPITRRISSPDGHFQGVLLTSLAPNYFSDFYSTVSLGQGSIIELLTDAGTILARAPATPGSFGRVTDTWSHIRALGGKQITTYHRVFPSDGIERIVSVAAVESYPLLVQVAVSTSDVLAAWRMQLYRQGAGTIVALLAILFLTAILLRQFTQLVASEAAVRRHAEVLDTTLKSMADAVIVADERRKVILSNPAAMRLLGFSPGMSDAQWAQTYRLFQGDGSTPMAIDQGALGRALRGERIDHMAVALRRVDDTKTIHLVASGRPIRDAKGAIKGAVLVFRDVTEAQETERQLRQAQKMEAVGQLTGGIAHDFNNILTVITGTIEILSDAVADQPKLAAVAKLIDDAAQRGADLTGQLLSFSRRQPLQPRDTDVNTLIVDTANLLRPTLGERVEIESMFEEDTWPALVDPGQLSTALLNLALNARDAMPTGGKLTLETANVILDEIYAKSHNEVTPGPYIMIAVSDTGTGIPAAIRDRVFEPFFTTKHEGKGSGLGLSMVYGFVKQSRGHINIYSEEGHGTTIKIYLPRASANVERRADAPPTALAEGGHETILVVEDDALVRNYVNSQLRGLGYSTLAACDANAALALIADGAAFDLLFTDVIMPGGMNGRKLAEEAIKRRPSLKVLFTSGYTENAIVHQGRLDPGVLLLTKPYRRSDLARMVRLALAAGPFGQAGAQATAAAN